MTALSKRNIDCPVASLHMSAAESLEPILQFVYIQGTRQFDCLICRKLDLYHGAEAR